MAVSHHTEDALLEQKIAPIVLEILRREADNLFREMVVRFVRENEQFAKDLSAIQRLDRVENDLKTIINTETVRFEATEKRFEAVLREMDKRFEAMDKRFEAMDQRFEGLQREMNARFEAMDKRFEALQRELNARFEAIDKRFEAMDKRFEAMDKRFTTLQWTMGLGFSSILIFMSLLKWWG